MNGIELRTRDTTGRNSEMNKRAKQEFFLPFALLYLCRPLCDEEIVVMLRSLMNDPLQDILSCNSVGCLYSNSAFPPELNVDILLFQTRISTCPIARRTTVSSRVPSRTGTAVPTGPSSSPCPWRPSSTTTPRTAATSSDAMGKRGKRAPLV